MDETKCLYIIFRTSSRDYLFIIEQCLVNDTLMTKLTEIPIFNTLLYSCCFSFLLLFHFLILQLLLLLLLFLPLLLILFLLLLLVRLTSAVAYLPLHCPVAALYI